MAPTDQTTASSPAAHFRAISRGCALGAFTVLAALALAAPAHALQLAPDSPHSPTTEDMSTAYWVMIAVAALVIVAINGALLAALVRFRAKRGRVAAPLTAGRGAMTRVAGGVGVLAIAIFVFAVVVTDSSRTIEAQAAAEVPAGTEEEPGQTPETGQVDPLAEPVEIDAIAQQWLWRFEYASGDREDIATLFSYGELVVPVDTTVQLNVTSTDVIHTWWVPALTGQVEAIPGSLSHTSFRADEVGVYEGRGTVFDGVLYPSLTASVRVVEPAEYEAHLEGLADDLAAAQAAVEEDAATAAGVEAQAEEAP